MLLHLWLIFAMKVAKIMEVFMKLVLDLLQNKDGRDLQEFNSILKN
jgi:hypothetical protein